jgi:DNA mismatch endonuclease (patch repair protein)
LVDYLTPEARSILMSRIRGKDTAPEMFVRRIVHSLGYRYRLHCRNLPGTPDLVFRRLRKIIFVHGCFWHRHEGCRFAYTPKTRRPFWEEKFRLNKERDRRHLLMLRRDGWDVLILWECELESPAAAGGRIRRFLCRTKSASKPTHHRQISKH